MTIDNIRLANARALAATLAKERGQQAKFAEHVGITRQLVNNYIGPNPTKRIGDDMARAIERAFQKPHGWLDERHDSDRTNLSRDSVAISPLGAGGILGAGRLGALLDTTVQQMNVSRDWAKQHLKGVVSDYLAIASVTGDSVGDVLPAGATVLVDRGASDVRADGIYMLGRERGAGVWFRNVKRELDGTLAISGGPGGAEVTRTKSINELGIVVLGRVVATLELKAL